jgi:hypothetical protein
MELEEDEGTSNAAGKSQCFAVFQFLLNSLVLNDISR